MRAGVEVGYTQAAASLTNRLTPQSISRIACDGCRKIFRRHFDSFDSCAINFYEN